MAGTPSSTPSLMLVHYTSGMKGVLILDDPTRRNGKWGLAIIAQAGTHEAKRLLNLYGRQGLWQADQRAAIDTAILESDFPRWPIIFLIVEGRSGDEIRRAGEAVITARLITLPDMTTYKGRLVPERFEGNLWEVNMCLPETEFGLAVHRYWESVPRENGLQLASLR